MCVACMLSGPLSQFDNVGVHGVGAVRGGEEESHKGAIERPLPDPTLPDPTRPYPTRPYPTLPYPTLPYPTLPYPTLPYPTPHPLE